MTRTGGPRGHGSGRAASAEAETLRRAKIRSSALQRKEKVRVVLVADYRLRGRSMSKFGHQMQALADWNYKRGRTYHIRVRPEELDDPSRLEEILNDLSPRRIHYNIQLLKMADSEDNPEGK